MPHDEFQPRKSVREEKRQATEAVKFSFCKTLAEPITNSDTSGKCKWNIPHVSGLVELMFSVPKGTQLDSATLRAKLDGKSPKRRIVIEITTAKTSGRPVGEVVIVDQGTGMSADGLKTALQDIAGDRNELAGGRGRRGVFGRGLSDVMQAHAEPVVQTYDGQQLTIVKGAWRENGWIIERDYFEDPSPSKLKKTRLDPKSTGTAVRFIIKDRKKCHIPDQTDISYRLGNFYMLRLIASDPNVELILRQRRAVGTLEERIEYDFPVGQVIESFSREFDAPGLGYSEQPLKIDFLVVRTDSERPMRSGGGVDNDARENGILIVDDLDAAYDLTFVDTYYEGAEYLKRVYGLVRVNGLREVCERCLNDRESPTSPLRPDRGGFNREHEFSRELLDFIAAALKPIYEREEKRALEKDRSKLSTETKKRLDNALKHLNKYFHDVTELEGTGTGTPGDAPKEPKESVLFFPRTTSPIAGRPRLVLLLVRDDVVESGAEVVVTASEGFVVQPETERISRRDSPRWPPHEHYYALRISVIGEQVGMCGKVEALVDGKDGDLEAQLIIENVLTEPEIPIPETLEFRPSKATGRPLRRNNLTLYVNPSVVSAGHYIRVELHSRAGDIKLLDANGARSTRVDIKLNKEQHQVPGQSVFKVLIPWNGTSWNQHAKVEASVNVGGAKPLMATATIRIDESDDGGFFKRVEYDDLGKETLAPSKFAAGVITINARDGLNRMIFGNPDGEPKEVLKVLFDRRLKESELAQQRVAFLLLEEASFRALEHLRLNNQLHLHDKREVSTVHEAIDKYKYESALAVHRALVRSST